MSFPALIGITGKAGVGKDTLAHYLHIIYGYHRYALAQPIKDALNARFGWKPVQWNDRAWKEAGSVQCGDGAAGRFSPRSWAQWLGTEVGRELHGEDCWIRLMRREWASVRNSVDGMVVSDIRFDNEAAAIRDLGGVVICVERSAAQPIVPHKSERGVSASHIDVMVANNSSIAEFLAEAFNALAGHLKPNTLKSSTCCSRRSSDCFDLSTLGRGFTMIGPLIGFDDLRKLSRLGDAAKLSTVERWAKRVGIRYQYDGRGGIWTTVDAMNAAIGLSTMKSDDTAPYDVEMF